MDRQVGAVDLLADARQARQHGHADADRGDRVAVALEHPHPAAPQCEDRGGEQDQPDDHPLRLLASQHRIDAVDHHDPHAREHRHEREQVGVGVGQREADHQMRGQAQGEEQRAVGERHARGVVERQVGGGARGVVLGLDEDRREATRDEQRGGHQSQELPVARAEHRSSVPIIAARALRPARYACLRACRSGGRCARAFSGLYELLRRLHPMDDERPPSLWWGMWKRFLLAATC